ncbi:hypothetical protein MKX03_012150 [Papaver bracteatum]|nr:hypothetical protein MKX03_012150 [Papaver bracteatum]
MDAIEESNERSNRGNHSEESELSENGDCVDGDQSNKQERGANEEPDASINEILNNVTINKIETPVSTIKAIINKNKNNNEGLRFNRRNLKKVEEQLKSAFVNFYHKLQLLKNYSYLNLLAFSKTMKRYDKGQALRNVAFYICYYASGDYKTRETSCKTNNVYNSFYIMLGAFPFWLRALQVSDVFLRFAWLQTVLNIQLPFLHKEAMVTVVACLEIIRRGVWNFFSAVYIANRFKFLTMFTDSNFTNDMVF